VKTKLEPFLATFTGGKFYPFGPDPQRINVLDIAHSLSNICRYNGHTTRFWSVAAHSLEVARRCEENARKARLGEAEVRKVALVGLLHDASEAYLMDVPKPIKPLFLNYDAWEENVDRALACAFDLPFPMSEEVKAVDDGMVPVEVANFFPPGSEAWARYGITPSNRSQYPTLTPLAPETAEHRFLLRYHALAVKTPELPPASASA
jgi:hypothetical protein